MCSCKSDQAAEKQKEKPGAWVWVLLLAGWVHAGCSTVPERFSPSIQIDRAQVSHQILSDMLKVSVQDGQVNYPALQTDLRFAAYLAQLDRVDPLALTSDRDRLAFWINAYNVFAIRGILDGYRPRPYLEWYRYFKVREYAVGGAKLNLYDLEHEILRKQFREPRVHFAIVCASVSCPKLQSSAYEGGMLDHQLDQVARAFINDTTRNRFDRRQKIAYLSKIFDWFEEDFAASAGSVPPFLARYVQDAEVARDLAAGLYRIEYLDYDWSLNGIAPKETVRAGTS
jgi:hypothetical protein